MEWDALPNEWLLGTLPQVIVTIILNLVGRVVDNIGNVVAHWLIYRVLHIDEWFLLNTYISGPRCNMHVLRDRKLI